MRWECLVFLGALCFTADGSSSRSFISLWPLEGKPPFHALFTAVKPGYAALMPSREKKKHSFTLWLASPGIVQRPHTPTQRRTNHTACRGRRRVWKMFYSHFSSLTKSESLWRIWTKREAACSVANVGRWTPNIYYLFQFSSRRGRTVWHRVTITTTELFNLWVCDVFHRHWVRTQHWASMWRSPDRYLYM